MKILLLTAPVPAAPFREAILAVEPDLELIEFGPDLSDAALAGIEVALAWRLPSGLAPRMPELKWICAIAAGVEKLLVPDLAPHVIVSRIVDDAQAEGIAQFVALMALRHARALTRYEAQQGQRLWRREPAAAVRSRVAVLGMGAMGSAIARLLGLVGFDVQGWSRSDARPLTELLGTSEIVVCALPLTVHTRGLLDASAFASMPRGSYLINVARGEHVVEDDLLAAVRSGHLAGASLDVQCHEPMAADDPLWDAPGITITPHIAAQSSAQTIAAQFLAGLRRFRQGEPPANCVDRARGY